MKKPASFSQAESIRSIIKKEKRRNNMRKKRIMALLLAGTMFTASLWGCGNNEGGGESSQGSQSQSSEQAQGEPEDVVDLEMWVTNPGYLAVEKGGVMYNFYKDLIGVGLTEPYVEWNGGETYGKQLNMRSI